MTGEGAWEARGWRRTPRRCRMPPASASDTSRRTVSEATWPCYFETRAESNYMNIKVSIEAPHGIGIKVSEVSKVSTVD